MVSTLLLPLSFLGEERGLLTRLLFVFLGIEMVLSFEMVMRGKYKGNLNYRKVDLVETLLPPVSVGWALTQVTPPFVNSEESTT